MTQLWFAWALQWQTRDRSCPPSSNQINNHDSLVPFCSLFHQLPNHPNKATKCVSLAPSSRRLLRNLTLKQSSVTLPADPQWQLLLEMLPSQSEFIFYHEASHKRTAQDPFILQLVLPRGHDVCESFKNRACDAENSSIVINLFLHPEC